MRENFGIRQIRQFNSSEKIRIKCQKIQNYQNSIISNSNNLNNTFLKLNKDWVFKNQFKEQKSSNLESKKLIIYPYSFSPNLLKEILLKTGLKFVLTNDIKKASIIIGLKKHLKQNFKLINLAKQKNIPVYALNQISLYQITKMIQLLKL